VFLRYVCDLGFQTGVGVDVGIQQSTVSRTIVFLLKIVEKGDMWMTFPNSPRDIQSAKDAWRDKFNIPCAIGALDCTHEMILSPGKRHGGEYINRKGFASLNVQATCDAGEFSSR
jgi:hypothetical protein